MLKSSEFARQRKMIEQLVGLLPPHINVDHYLAAVDWMLLTHPEVSAGEVINDEEAEDAATAAIATLEVSTKKTEEGGEPGQVVGHYWRSCGIEYYCDSYDPQLGYWMTPVKGSTAPTEFEFLLSRRNVSERAIGRTYTYSSKNYQ